MIRHLVVLRIYEGGLAIGLYDRLLLLHRSQVGMIDFVVFFEYNLMAYLSNVKIYRCVNNVIDASY